MEPIIYTQCSTRTCKTTLPLCLRHSSFQTLDGSPLSALVPPPCPSSRSIHSSPLRYLTLPASPLSHPPCPSFPPLPGYYVWPLSTLILRLYSIHLSSFTSHSTSTSLGPPLIESPISCIATSIHMHTLTLKPIGAASTRDSYCPSALQRKGVKSWRNRA